MTFGFCRRPWKKPLIISNQGKFRQKMSLYLTSWHILSQLEVGFITDFHSWRNCEFQMFCVFLSAVFTPMRNEPPNLRQLWHSIHHLCRMMMDGKKYIFEVLYYPSYDSHSQKTKFWKSSKFLIWRKNGHFPHCICALYTIKREN
jgi:hypothetical protein